MHIFITDKDAWACRLAGRRIEDVEDMVRSLSGFPVIKRIAIDPGIVKPIKVADVLPREKTCSICGDGVGTVYYQNGDVFTCFMCHHESMAAARNQMDGNP